MREQEDLNNIWKNIEDRKYNEAVEKLKDFWPGPYIVPSRLFSDEGGDCMSVPNQQGTQRDIYRRKSVSALWELL